MNHKAYIYQVLHGHQYMTLATASADGKPEAATVHLVPDGNTLLVQSSKPTYRKVANLRANPRAACVVTKGHEHTLQFDCSVEELTGNAAVKARQKMIVFESELERFLRHDSVFFLLTPYWMRLRVYSGSADTQPGEYVYECGNA